MGQKSIFAFTTRLFVVLLLLMATHAANVAQLKNQQQHQTPQQQQTTLGQVTTSQQHHGPAQLQQHQHHQQSAAPHPGSNANAGHRLGAHSLSASSSSSSSSAAASSSSSTSSSSMPPAQFVNDKDATAAAVQEVLKHFNADDDLSDPYQLLNELKREANAASGLTTQPAAPPPASPLSGLSSNYPWSLFERSPYGSASYNPMPLPPMPAIAGLFPHLFSPFEGYPSSFSVTPRFMPYMSYPQPILVPYPFYMTPEMFYPGFSPIANEFEDSMSRGAAASARRPSPLQHTTSGYSRNSPIYYVRLPPTPYMFLPSLGLGATPSAMSGFPAMMPYQSLPSFPSFSSVFNVPINFLANGKPNNIYQMGGSPNDLQSPLQFANVPANYQSRPPPPPPPPHHSASSGGGYRPTSSTHNYLNSPPIASSSNNYGSSYPSAGGSSSSSSAPSSPQPLQSDSKLTSLKRPYFFNGRPEDIYILPNNFNSLYSAENSYY